MSTAKNIALFSLAYDPFFGGAEIAIQEITKRIPDAAFSCITYRFERDWPAAVHSMAARQRRRIIYGSRIRKPKNFTGAGHSRIFGA